MLPLLAVSVFPTSAVPEIVGRPVAGLLVTSVLMAILIESLEVLLQLLLSPSRNRRWLAMLQPPTLVSASEVVGRIQYSSWVLWCFAEPVFSNTTK